MFDAVRVYYIEDCAVIAVLLFFCVREEFKKWKLVMNICRCSFIG